MEIWRWRDEGDRSGGVWDDRGPSYCIVPSPFGLWLHCRLLPFDLGGFTFGTPDSPNVRQVLRNPSPKERRL